MKLSNDEKHCNGCGNNKSKSEFNRDRCQRDGLQSQCIKCKRAAQRRDYQLKKEIYYNRTKKYREKNPLVAKAHRKVSHEIKMHRLVKPDECPVCGCNDKRIEAHHHKGYDGENALDVLFLCTTCHREAE